MSQNTGMLRFIVIINIVTLLLAAYAALYAYKAYDMAEYVGSERLDDIFVEVYKSSTQSSQCVDVSKKLLQLADRIADDSAECVDRLE